MVVSSDLKSYFAVLARALPEGAALPSIAGVILNEKMEEPSSLAREVTLLNPSELNDEARLAHEKVMEFIESELMKALCALPDLEGRLKIRLGLSFVEQFPTETPNFPEIIHQLIEGEPACTRLPFLYYLLNGTLDLALSEIQLEKLADLFDKFRIEEFAPSIVLLHLPTNAYTLKAKFKAYLESEGDIRFGRQIFTYLNRLKNEELVRLLNSAWAQECCFDILLLLILYRRKNQASEALKVLKSYRINPDLLYVGNNGVNVVLGNVEVGRLEPFFERYQGPVFRWSAKTTAPNKLPFMLLPPKEFYHRLVRFCFACQERSPSYPEKLERVRVLECFTKKVASCIPFTQKLPHPERLQHLEITGCGDFSMEKVEPSCGFFLEKLSYKNVCFEETARSLTRRVVKLRLESCSFENKQAFAKEISFSRIRKFTALKMSITEEVAKALGSLDTLEKMKIDLNGHYNRAFSVTFSPTLIALSVSSNMAVWGEDKIQPIIEMLIHGALKNLTLCVQLEKQAAELFASALKTSSSLKTLKIWVGSENYPAIFEAIAGNKKLESLESFCIYEALGKESIAGLMEVIRAHRGVHISLYGGNNLALLSQHFSPGELFNLL